MFEGCFFDYDGEPISMEEWASLNHGREHDLVRWRVGLTEVEGWEISTIWIGCDVRIDRDGPPLIFETLVTRPTDGDQRTYRYATEEEALDGHARLVGAIGELLEEARQ